MKSALAFLLAVVVVSSLKAPRLVEWNGEEARLMFQEEIEARLNASKTKWVNFVDLSDHKDFAPGGAAHLKASDIPSAPTQQATVNRLVRNVNQENIRRNIQALSDLFTRYDTTETGVEAANYLAEQFQSYAGDRADVSVTLFMHPQWAQPSVVVTVHGTDSSKVDRVLMGAHEDSIGRTRNGRSRSPGADDDATGVCAMLEAFRVLMEADFKPARTMQFLSFAAEETGLRGSTDMVRRYFEENEIPVMGLLQSEMNGYQVKKMMTLIDDQFTDSELTAFVAKLIGEYVDDDYKDPNFATCGSCSDHVPFSRAGYRAACMAEDGPYGHVNPYMHTEEDTLQHVTMEQVAQFSKLGVAFCVEMSMAP